MPDHPLVTVEIRGVNRAGKSTVAHLLHLALREEGIEFSGPANLPSFPLSAAIGSLRKRGLSVELIETETGARQQVDARIGGRR